MELHVFDLDFNRLGVIKSYDNVTIERHYLAHDTLNFSLKAKQDIDEFTDNENYYEVRSQIIDMLFTEQARNEGRIICKSNDLSRGYLVRLEQALDEDPHSQDKEVLQFTAFGLKYMLRSRGIPSQQVFNGNIEQAMRYFVTINCISPTNLRRIIPNLILGDLSGVDIIVDAAFNGEWLDDALFALGSPHEVSYDIVMNHDIQKYILTVFKGTDRSVLQDDLEPVIFAKKFGNVVSESFIDDRTNEATTAIVVGHYEEAIDTYDVYAYSGDSKTGLNRWEVVVDVRGEVQSIYTDADDIDYSMTEQEYKNALKAKGDSVLSEYKRRVTFESTVGNYPDYVFDIDYFLGDVVSTVNTELGVQMHRRIIQVSEQYTVQDYSIDIALGDGVLEFNQALKRELKYR